MSAQGSAQCPVADYYQKLAARMTANGNALNAWWDYWDTADHLTWIGSGHARRILSAGLRETLNALGQVAPLPVPDPVAASSSRAQAVAYATELARQAAVAEDQRVTIWQQSLGSSAP